MWSTVFFHPAFYLGGNACSEMLKTELILFSCQTYYLFYSHSKKEKGHNQFILPFSTLSSCNLTEDVYLKSKVWFSCSLKNVFWTMQSMFLMLPGSEKIQKRTEVLKEYFHFWPLSWKEAFKIFFWKKIYIIYQSCRASVTYSLTNYSTFDHLFILLWQNFSSAYAVLMAVGLKTCIGNGPCSKGKSACFVFLLFRCSFSIFDVQQGILSV